DGRRKTEDGRRKTEDGRRAFRDRIARHGAQFCRETLWNTSDEAAAVGRPAPVRGTASNNQRDAPQTGSHPTRGPRSRPTKTERQQSGDRRLFEAPPRTTREPRKQQRRSPARASKSPDQNTARP